MGIVQAEPSGPRSEAKASLPWLAALLLALITLAAFWPAVSFDYTNYDDPDYAAHNPTVQEGLTWAGVQWAFTTSARGHWHPLTWLSYMAVSDWLGNGAGAQHLMNLVLHALNAALLLLALGRLTGATGPSLVVAALFALHPLHVESVAWVASRKDVLSGVFWMGALWLYVGYARRPSAGAMAGVMACFAAGLMAKPTVLTLPFVFLLLDYWPLRRLSMPGLTGGTGSVPWPRLLVEKIPLFCLAAGSAVATLWASQDSGVFTVAVQVPWLDRLGNALVSYVLYLVKTIVPTGLAVLYPHPGAWALWQVGGALLLLLVLTLLVLSWLNRAPWLAVGWFWFLGVMVPMIGLVQVGLQSMADRYTYLPLIGFFIAVVWSGRAIGDSGSRPGRWCPILAVIVLLGCLILTRSQLRHWRTSEALFGHALAVTRENAVAHHNLGLALAEAGRPTEALRHFEEAARIRPAYSDTHNNLGMVLFVLGRIPEAMAQYRIAIEQNPAGDMAHYNLAVALQAQGDKEAARTQFETAIRKNPLDVRARTALGRLLTESGRSDEAMVPLREALALSPGFPDAHFALGLALMRSGRVEEAGSSLRQATESGPLRAEARMEYGAWLAGQGRRREALDYYRSSLQVRPDYPQACNNLAWLLATTPDDALRNGAEAVRLAEHACRLTGQQEPFMLGTLAAAYAEVGRFDEAVATASRAVELAEKAGWEEVARRNRELREVYRSEHPWREP